MKRFLHVIMDERSLVLGSDRQRMRRVTKKNQTLNLQCIARIPEKKKVTIPTSLMRIQRVKLLNRWSKPASHAITDEGSRLVILVIINVKVIENKLLIPDIKLYNCRG